MPYPTVPGRRMAWDVDGSIALLKRDGAFAIAELDGTQRSTWNSQDMSGSFFSIGGFTNGDPGYLWFIFPELREFDGFFHAGRPTPTAADRVTEVATSSDTTNGLDGSWTQRIANYAEPAATAVPVEPDAYREFIQSVAVNTVRGVRVRITNHGNQNTLGPCHLYGEISAGQTPDRLLWVDETTGSEFTLPIDYGDIPRGSAEDRKVILRNNSSSLTASSVQITAESLTGDFDDDLTFREDGVSGFQATLPLDSSISPSSDSGDITVRRVTADDRTLGPYAARIYVTSIWS